MTTGVLAQTFGRGHAERLVDQRVGQQPHLAAIEAGQSDPSHTLGVAEESHPARTCLRCTASGRVAINTHTRSAYRRRRANSKAPADAASIQ